MDAALSDADRTSLQQTQAPLPPLRPDDSSAYWLRRRRNNEAARRCRERRRMEEILLELHATELLRENQRLRAALCALYPGPPTSEWPLTTSTCSVQPGDNRLPYRAWTLPPVFPTPPPPPPDMTTLHCHFLPSSSPVPVPGLMVSPSHTAPCTSAPVPPSQHTASPANPMSSLPHKLRLKGARALLRYGKMGCPNKGGV